MLKYIKYLSVLFLLFHGNMVYPQEVKAFNLFATGNSFGENTDNELYDQLKIQTGRQDNFAVLLTGNVVDAQTGQISDEFFLNDKHALLIAPGKNEWASGSRDGKEFIKQLTDDVSEKFSNPVFYPEKACPGPVEVVLDDHLVVILIDTWWWVHKYDRRFNKCGIESPAEVLLQIEDAIRRHHATKHIVVSGYHSLKSFGNTNGYFSAKQWLLELPNTLYRKLAGTRIDSQHPEFKDFRNGLLSVLKKYPDALYVSAGDANLQYFEYQKTHFVISGAWQGGEYVRKNLPEYSSNERGFIQLTFFPEGGCNLTVFNSEGAVFKKNLYQKKFKDDRLVSVSAKDFPDSMNVVASNKYTIFDFCSFWMGENYREVWATSVKTDVFDIGTKKGGLKVLKRGGGQQTLSLRLEDKDGNQYVLRSIDKNVEGALPEDLHKTFVMDLVQDQISASNPYAAPVVSALTDYAGLYHTNPEVVYVPDDPRFGIYRRDVAGKLFLFEERPDDDRSDVESFGYSENIISTENVLEKITESPDHFVDEEAVLRARLFDIVINDWDRHEDQWRWADFEHHGKTVYRPIPRDRDQAFFVNEGVLPWITARKWLLPKIQGFAEYTRNIEGLSYNARYFDRTFLTQSSWDDWLLQIDTLRALLTPQNIDSAMQFFPKEVYPLCGPQTAQILKARIENLQPMAYNLYLSLANEISIVGTGKSDLFEIFTPTDTMLRISGYKMKKNGKKDKLFYNRTFYASETKKIHLYGFDGDDRFVLKGDGPSRINLNIIGGKNKDEIISYKEMKPHKISIYDKKNTEVSPDLLSSLTTHYDGEALNYDRKHFEFDMVFPGLFSGYNPDDGVFIGGGPVLSKYSRYRQQRYGFLGNYAFSTNAFNFRFGAQQSLPLRRLEINFSSRYNSPGYAGNFFGMGNETAWKVPRSEKEYYRLRMSRFYTERDFIKWMDKEQKHKTGPGFFYSISDAEQTTGRFITEPVNGLTNKDLAIHAYAGAYFKYELNTLNGMEWKTEEKFGGSKFLPTRGMNLETKIWYYAGLNEESDNFLKLSGDWITYFSFSQRPRLVYALRVGGEKLLGDYVFHEAAKLGLNENLRGYRQTRFYGDASVYLNAEVRIRMKQFQTYLLNGTAGMLIFNDTGRVWYEEEDSQKWHNGTGLGLWFSPFDMAMLSISYAVSPDDQLLNLSVNYQF
jgi:hypothetical protein